MSEAYSGEALYCFDVYRNKTSRFEPHLIWEDGKTSLSWAGQLKPRIREAQRCDATT